MTNGEIVDEIVIDANMDLQWPHRMSLMPPSHTCSALMPYRVGLYLEAPCTHKAILCSHHLAEDDEDPIDGVEDPRYGDEAFMDDGEYLYGMEKH